jgi:hypothetical protein
MFSRISSFYFFKLQVKNCFNLYKVLGEDSNLHLQEDEDLDENFSDE